MIRSGGGSRSRQRMSAARLRRDRRSHADRTARPAEEPTDVAGPGHGREFVDGRDQEAGQAAIDRFVDRQDRQRRVAREVAVDDSRRRPAGRSGLSALGTSWNDWGLNFSPHQGQFSRGMGDGLSIVVLEGDRLAIGDSSGRRPRGRPCDWAWPPGRPRGRSRTARGRACPGPSAAPAPEHRSGSRRGRADRGSADGACTASARSSPAEAYPGFLSRRWTSVKAARPR